MDAGYIGGAVGIDGHIHAVAHGNGIGRPDTTQSESALYTRINLAPVVGKYDETASGVAHNHSCGTFNNALLFPGDHIASRSLSVVSFLAHTGSQS